MIFTVYNYSKDKEVLNMVIRLLNFKTDENEILDMMIASTKHLTI